MFAWCIHRATCLHLLHLFYIHILLSKLTFFLCCYFLTCGVFRLFPKRSELLAVDIPFFYFRLLKLAKHFFFVFPLQAVVFSCEREILHQWLELHHLSPYIPTTPTRNILCWLYNSLSCIHDIHHAIAKVHCTHRAPVTHSAYQV